MPCKPPAACLLCSLEVVLQLDSLSACLLPAPGLDLGFQIAVSKYLLIKGILKIISSRRAAQRVFNFFFFEFPLIPIGYPVQVPPC